MDAITLADAKAQLSAWSTGSRQAIRLRSPVAASRLLA